MSILSIFLCSLLIMLQPQGYKCMPPIDYGMPLLPLMNMLDNCSQLSLVLLKFIHPFPWADDFTVSDGFAKELLWVESTGTE